MIRYGFVSFVASAFTGIRVIRRVRLYLIRAIRRVRLQADGKDPMTIDSWLQAALADAERRGLPELKPMLEALAHYTRELREADFNGEANGTRGSEDRRQQDR